MPAWASPLLAWRVTRAGLLELRTAPGVIPKAFFETGTRLQGPRVWVDLSGSGSIPRDRTLRGGGALREVRIGSPDGLTTRLMLEFALDAKLDSSGLRLVGISPDRWRMALIGLGNQASSGIGEGDPDGLQKIQPQSPELPSKPPAGFDASLAELVRDGVVSPEERARIRSSSGIIPSNLSAHQHACSSGSLAQQLKCISDPPPTTSISRADNPLSVTSSKRSSRDITNEIYRRRSAGFINIGFCSYDWAGWRLDSRGVRTTRFRCGENDFSDNQMIAVDCRSLKISRYSDRPWTRWSFPADDDEVKMVSRLCANTINQGAKTPHRQHGLAGIPVLLGVITMPGPRGSVSGQFEVNGVITYVQVGEAIGGTAWRLISASGDSAIIKNGKQELKVFISSGW